ncbi:MAG: 30S ribosome-binding factor RbfA [Treponema sp.]|jgi:ribosome-binding factor A|nr:30S ribosome-binding factor RbfA [Treponema sp.]MBP5696755.1 30S ribosome-binding factor RbfA [Treponema sp.]MBQ1670855.1 30S ribosome-binding factor RbfA [Treponema sp.]MBQ1714114.1 30S ribosome-binding factor RbfA [Treponema sp.]MBQ1726454.1 30S ribosome-binding factor RbfA [Treponema sp.]
MGQYRLVRLGEQLKSEISNMIIRHEIKDPRVNEFLTIHRVDVAGDLAYAKVYVSSFMDENSVKRGVQGLQSAAGFIQSSIAKKLTIYKFPKLTFIADSSIKDGYEMVQKLNALEKEEAALAPESPAESSAQSSDEEE